MIGGDMITYRPDIQVLDATIRDGGLVNDFYFTDEFIHNLYKANVKAGVDYMEFGYKASKELFDVNKFGKWKFCDDEDIRAVVGDNNTDLKIAVMADVGRCNYKQDIKPRAESPVDVIRVATYINQIPAAVDVIEDAVAKGYEVTCNIMAISNAQEADIRVALFRCIFSFGMFFGIIRVYTVVFSDPAQVSPVTGHLDQNRSRHVSKR